MDRQRREDGQQQQERYEPHLIFTIFTEEFTPHPRCYHCDRAIEILYEEHEPEVRGMAARFEEEWTGPTLAIRDGLVVGASQRCVSHLFCKAHWLLDDGMEHMFNWESDDDYLLFERDDSDVEAVSDEDAGTGDEADESSSSSESDREVDLEAVVDEGLDR